MNDPPRHCASGSSPHRPVPPALTGQGLADPPYPRLFPENLVNHNDGPPMYNLRAKFEGFLAGPAGYAVEESVWGAVGDNFDWKATDDALSAVRAGGRADGLRWMGG